MSEHDVIHAIYKRMTDNGPFVPMDRAAPMDKRLLHAARRFRDAVSGLSRFGGDGKTLFEGSPLKDQACYDAWVELREAGAELDAVLSDAKASYA